MIGKYANGNYNVIMEDDGTKVRFTGEDNFIPEFAESIDLTITKKCDGACKFCYMGCTPEGKHCDFKRYSKFIDSLKPFTEVAINGNDLTHPGLTDFLVRLKEKNVIANLTVNNIHLDKNIRYIDYLVSEDLIKGIGISPIDGRFVTSNALKFAKEHENAVFHIINGIFNEKLYNLLKDRDCKILILGYKDVSRGNSYKAQNSDIVFKNQYWLKENITKVMDGFKAVTFDNLAIDQLSMRDVVSPEVFEENYMGDEGEFTYYADLVAGTYAVTSFDSVQYMIGDKDSTECFKAIREKVRGIENAM